MRQFLEQLFNTGDVTVVPPGKAFEPPGEESENEILRFDRAARLSLATEAPALDLEVAAWAARLLAESARLAVARELGSEKVEEVFARECPNPRSPEVDYSADLFLRYIPDLLKWVQRLAAEDPLVEQLRRTAGAWPLSSVGIRDLTIGPIDPFMKDPGLRQLYVDRILSTGDLSRLNDERVTEAVRAAIGAHPELSPVIAREVGIVAGTTD